MLLSQFSRPRPHFGLLNWSFFAAEIYRDALSDFGFDWLNPANIADELRCLDLVDAFFFFLAGTRRNLLS